MKKISLLIFLSVLILISCKSNKEKEVTVSPPKTIEYQELNIKYAKGFDIKTTTTGYDLMVKNAWPGSDSQFVYHLITGDHDNNNTSQKKSNSIQTPVEKIIVTSTTHLPPLVLLGAENTLVGFPGTDYISAPKVRNLINQEKVQELGTTQQINLENTVLLNPDLVMGYSVTNENSWYKKIEHAGIPVVYNGEWVEEHPLGKAEWIKVFGVLYGKVKEADSIFNVIEREYNNTLELVKNTTPPVVISGATWKDQWYLPYGSSWQGRILKDAGANYIYASTIGGGSLSYSIEKVLMDGHDAAYWIAPAQYTSYTEMLKDQPAYALFKAFKNRQIYTHALTVGTTGGVIYYEEASMRPDLVLRDLVKILHPNLQLDHELYFFKPLKD
jgi:iron complex transport system substrate-binding protein